MDEEYDVIILGTGLKECIMSGLLSVDKKKVLHMDKNDYYGGESASMTPLKNLFKKFDRMEEYKDDRPDLGKGRNYNVDLIPKFLMTNGQLVQMLVHTDVTRYLEFKVVDGSYVYKAGKIHKVPATTEEAIKTSLMGFFEKRKFRNFLIWMNDYNVNDKSTWKDISPGLPMKQVYEKFNLDSNTQDFIGHSMALYRTDDYKNSACSETIAKIKLYQTSLYKFGKSPYIYPLYGLGELPQGFARLSAIYGGTYMLDKPITKIEANPDTGMIEVTSQNETVRGKQLIASPDYFPNKCMAVGKVIRAICIIDHPIKDTVKCNSVQIILPQNQVGRKHDIYVMSIGNDHNVADKNMYLAMVSTTVETNNPKEELKPGLDLLKPIKEIFWQESVIYEPIDDGKDTNIFISKSFDATTHFETTCEDIKSLWHRVTGKPIDFDKLKRAEGDNIDNSTTAQ